MRTHHRQSGDKHPYLVSTTYPRVFAHRGLATPDLIADGAVENTIAAIAAAHAAGCEYVETDVRASAEGVPVLIHDETLERILGDSRAVHDLSLRELTELFAPRGGLATLADAFASFPAVRFNIDVKSMDAVFGVAEIVAKHPNRALITSFDQARRVATLRAAAPDTPATSADSTLVRKIVLATLLGRRRHVRDLLVGIDALQLPVRVGIFPVITKRLLRFAHAAGTEVHAWTINTPSEMHRLVSLGVDGIVTDRADVALDALRD